MSDMQTTVTTRVTVNGESFVLAEDQDIDRVKQQIESIARSPGGFVEFAATGDRIVSVFVSSATQIVFSRQTVHYHPDDENGQDIRFTDLLEF